MIINKNEAKEMTNYVSCDSKCKFISTTCNSNHVIQIMQFKSWNNKTCLCECKNYRACKKDY